MLDTHENGHSIYSSPTRCSSRSSMYIKQTINFQQKWNFATNTP